MKKVLVLGVGNVLLKDDGLGPLVVKELEEIYESPNVTFLDGGTLGLDLLAYLEGYTTLVIIDALDLNKEPGSIFCWEVTNANGFPHQVSIHQVGVKELLYAANMLEMDLEVVVMGVQVADVSWGLELTEKVKEAVPILKDNVIKRLNQYLENKPLDATGSRF